MMNARGRHLGIGSWWSDDFDFAAMVDGPCFLGFDESCAVYNGGIVVVPAWRPGSRP